MEIGFANGVRGIFNDMMLDNLTVEKKLEFLAELTDFPTEDKMKKGFVAAHKRHPSGPEGIMMAVFIGLQSARNEIAPEMQRLIISMVIDELRAQKALNEELWQAGPAVSKRVLLLATEVAKMSEKDVLTVEVFVNVHMRKKIKPSM